MSKSLFVFTCLVAIALSMVPPANLPETPYAEWAHHHWVWLNHGDQNQ